LTFKKKKGTTHVETPWNKLQLPHTLINFKKITCYVENYPYVLAC